MDRGDARDKISKENLCLFPEKLKGNKTYESACESAIEYCLEHLI